MSDLLNAGTSTYGTGGIDTYTPAVNNTDIIEAKHPNGLAEGIVQMQGKFGQGTVLAGSLSNLAARLAVRLNPDGTLKTVPTGEGGTNLTSYTKGDMLYASADDVLSKLGKGLQGQALQMGGSDVPLWGYAGVYSGPESMGSGSLISAGGDIIISTNQNPYTGIKYASTYTLNTGVSLTLGASGYRLVIISSEAITINGTINASGSGGTGGSGSSDTGASGNIGHEGGSGGGGGSSSVGGGDAGGAGGNCTDHWSTLLSGGAGGSGSSDIGDNGTNVSVLYHTLYGKLYGGAGGGEGGGAGGGGADGGAGGGSIVLIAPVVTLGSSSTINTSGAVGGNGSGNNGSGGGGGGGNLIVVCQTFDDQGCTFNQAGGSGGSGGSASGGNGGNGFKQILIYS